MRRILAAILLAATVSGASAPKGLPAPLNRDPFALMYGEHLGPLAVGLAESEVRRRLPRAPTIRQPPQLWDADGRFHETWATPGTGIEVGLVRDRPEGPATLESITVTAPCTWTTRRGILIGSTEREARQTYHGDLDPTSGGQGLTAGSIYGGLHFQFRKGRVVRIFLGAAVE